MQELEAILPQENGPQNEQKTKLNTLIRATNYAKELDKLKKQEMQKLSTPLL